MLNNNMAAMKIFCYAFSRMEV